MKIVLAGSPQIAIKAFEKIINNFDVVAIITKPDRKQGRGLKVDSTPVAKLAQEHKIKIFKPLKIMDIYEQLKVLNFDLLLTFAFGQFIPEKILQLGKLKPLNIHGSLLPKYRGAAPIQHAILNGENEIGITLMEMIKKMDAGAIYFQKSQKITDKTTTGNGFKIISNLAQNNIVKWINQINNHEISPVDQGSNFTLAPKINKSFGQLSSSLTLSCAIRKIRALNPFPGAFIFKNNKRLKIFDVSDHKTANSIELKFLDGNLFVTDYQWEGKKRNYN